MIFLRNILRTKARSLMTILGVSGGIAVFVAISSMTADLRSQINEVTTVYNTDIVIQSRKAATPFSSIINAAQMDQLHRILGEDIFPMILGSLSETWNPYVFIIGSPHSLATRFALTEGQSFTSDRSEVMIGALCARKLGVGVGQSISLGGENYIITGIFRTGSRLLDGGIMTNLTDAQLLLGRKDSFSIALIQTADQKESLQEIARINKSFPALRAQQSIEFTGTLRVFKLAGTIATTVTAIALIGACIIVTNTLLMAVAERTREIGILMAVGWNPLLVLRMLLAESLFLCLLGAVFGNLLGLGLLQGLNRIKSIGFGWIPVHISFESFTLSLSIALVLGVVSLTWPAIILLRIQPAEALRHE